MCTKYTAPDDLDTERHWRVGRGNDNPFRGGLMAPSRPGPFFRAGRAGPGGPAELCTGRWGLVPGFSKTLQLKLSTFNARAEELAAKPSYRDAWRRGQRCIIPAWAFSEPCWETGRNVWWWFRRRDGLPWGLAGLWNAWTDPHTGEVHETYTMLTLNADAHPLMRRMHKPDPALPQDAQDKRSVVPIEAADVDTWLHGSLDDARALVRLAPVERFEAAPDDAGTAAAQPDLF